MGAPERRGRKKVNPNMRLGTEATFTSNHEERKIRQVYNREVVFAAIKESGGKIPATTIRKMMQGSTCG